MFCNIHITTAACYCWIIIIIIHNRFFSMCIITISILYITYNLLNLLTRSRSLDALFLVEVINGFKCRQSLLQAIGIRVTVRSFRDYPLITVCPSWKRLLFRWSETKSLTYGHRRAYCPSPRWHVSVESNGWHNADRGNRRWRRKTCPSATLSTTSPTRTWAQTRVRWWEDDD
jgi:hypothetical protein